MKLLFATAMWILVMESALGQPLSTIPANIRAANTLDRLSSQSLGMGDLVYGIPLPPGGVVGDTYLSLEWKKATLLLYDKDKLIEGYPVRYNIQADEVEIKASSGVKVLVGSKIKSFLWLDTLTNTPTYFVNGKEYKHSNGSATTGFFEVLSDGVLPALMKTNVAIRKADYNVGLDVGSRDDRVFKKKTFYYPQGNTVVEIPSSKKKLLLLFGAHAKAIDDFIKENNLTTKEPNHIAAIFNHYNKLVKQ